MHYVLLLLALLIACQPTPAVLAPQSMPHRLPLTSLPAITPIPQETPPIQGSPSPEALFHWQSTSPCAFLNIGEESVTFGECNATPQSIPETMARELRQQVIRWSQAYTDSESETAAGKIILQGHGDKPLPPEIARQMAEWAKAQWEIAVSGRTGAAWDLVFTFSRYGGIAGFCDDLLVYADGKVIFTSCKGREERSNLSPEQLQQMYRWLDTFASFEFHHADPPNVADGMTVNWTFSGRGTQPVDAATQEQMREFLSSLMGALYRP